jgi:PAS domain S-box-containing protein
MRGEPQSVEAESIEVAALRERIATLERDLDRHRRAEERLRRSASLLADAEQVADLGCWEWDVSGNTLSWSDELRRIYGLSVGDRVDGFEDYLARVHPQDRGRAQAKVERALRERSPFSFEERIVRPDGSVRVLRSAGTVLLDGQGHAARLCGVCQDVTEVRQAEAALHSIAENVPDVLARFDRQLRYVYVNRQIESRTGLRAEVFPGRTNAELGVPLDLVALWDGAALKAFESGQTVSIEFTCPIAIGPGYFEARMVPELGPSGEVETVLAVVRDVSERKRLEAELLLAQKMEAVGRLAGGVAHDFNNLLTVITGYADLLLLELAENDPRRTSAAEVKKAASRAAELTAQLLAFGRRSLVAPRVLDLNAAVIDAERMLCRLIGEDIDLNFHLGHRVGQVRMDPGQLVQVLVNLAANARDAMPRGGRLTVATCVVGPPGLPAGLTPGRYVALSVADTGEGMSEDVKARIFEPFFTTKEIGRGTGLGLASVYGIVLANGGHVEVDSAPGAGSTFRMYLPCCDALAEDQPQAEPARAGRGGETLLVVEDDEAVRAVIRLVLSQRGYTVLEASDAASATEVCGRHGGSVHLLVTDVVMPGAGGRELAERLTAHRPAMKVLYLSGYAADAVLRYGVQGTEVAFLQKPFTPQELALRVREILDG